MKLRRIAPALVALAIGAVMFGSVSWDTERSAAYAAKAESPAIGGGSISQGPLRALDGGGTSFECDWWGGVVHQSPNRYVYMDSYGDCDGGGAQFYTTLSATNANFGSKSTTTVTANDEDFYHQVGPAWGPVNVGQSVGWRWDVQMTVPSGYHWTSVNDPSHCAIQTNNQVVICLYTGSVIPYTQWPLPATATPFPTYVSHPQCSDVFAALALLPRTPRTVNVVDSETYAVGDLSAMSGIGIQRIARTLQWRNMTNGTTATFRDPIPVLPPLTGPSRELVFYDQPITVGNGFITASYVADIQLTSGYTCQVSASGNVTN